MLCNSRGIWIGLKPLKIISYLCGKMKITALESSESYQEAYAECFEPEEWSEKTYANLLGFLWFVLEIEMMAQNDPRPLSGLTLDF